MRTFRTVEELRQALEEFRERYNHRLLVQGTVKSFMKSRGQIDAANAARKPAFGSKPLWAEPRSRQGLTQVLTDP